MDGRVRLTINALSQSFDYFGPYFLPDLEGAWIRFSSMTKSSGTKTGFTPWRASAATLDSHAGIVGTVGPSFFPNKSPPNPTVGSFLK